MKTLFKISVATLGLTILMSCEAGKPLTSIPSENNKTYVVQYLFEHEGCKVYRFYDMGHYVYFTNCANQISSLVGDSIKTEVLTITKNIPEK